MTREVLEIRVLAALRSRSAFIAVIATGMALLVWLLVDRASRLEVLLLRTLATTIMVVFISQTILNHWNVSLRQPLVGFVHRCLKGPNDWMFYELLNTKELRRRIMDANLLTELAEEDNMQNFRDTLVSSGWSLKSVMADQSPQSQLARLVDGYFIKKGWQNEMKNLNEKYYRVLDQASLRVEIKKEISQRYQLKAFGLPGGSPKPALYADIADRILYLFVGAVALDIHHKKSANSLRPGGLGRLRSFLR